MKIEYLSKNKKAVSPVIATILLIGIVVVISLIVFFWFQGINEESITKFGNKNIKLVCGDVKFEASYSGGILSISNTGTVPFYNMNIKVSGAGGYETINLKSFSEDWPSKGLNQGEVFSGDISSISGLSSANNIIVIPILAGESKEGQKTYTCEENYGKDISI